MSDERLAELRARADVGDDASELLAEIDRARAELDRLRTWAGLMELLDAEYPADVFPTEPDRAARDPGPRIVSLLRQLDRLRDLAEEPHRVEESYGGGWHARYDGPSLSLEWCRGACEVLADLGGCPLRIVRVSDGAVVT